MISKIIESINKLHGGDREQQSAHRDYLNFLRKKREPSGDHMSTASDHPLLGVGLFLGSRRLTVGEAYVGHGPDDPSGYYYSFDDKPDDKHWVSASALPIRFTREPKEK